MSLNVEHNEEILSLTVLYHFSDDLLIKCKHKSTGSVNKRLGKTSRIDVEDDEFFINLSTKTEEGFVNYLKIETSKGRSLEVGKIADLVVLDANPLEDARNYRSIHLVIKDGRVVDLDALPVAPIISSMVVPN